MSNVQPSLKCISCFLQRVWPFGTEPASLDFKTAVSEPSTESADLGRLAPLFPAFNFLVTNLSTGDHEKLGAAGSTARCAA